MIYCKYFDTGKSFSEALILVSSNPQYDKRSIIKLRVQYMKMPSSEHVVYKTCSELGIFMYSTHNSMKNLLSYFWLVDARISASD